MKHFKWLKRKITSGFQPQELPRWNLKAKERHKKVPDPSGWVDGRFNKTIYSQGLSLAAVRRVDLSTTCRDLKCLYRSLNYILLNGLNNTSLFPRCFLQNGSHWGNGGQKVHSKYGKERETQMPGSGSPTGQTAVILSMTSSNINMMASVI